MNYGNSHGSRELLEANNANNSVPPNQILSPQNQPEPDGGASGLPDGWQMMWDHRTNRMFYSASLSYTIFCVLFRVDFTSLNALFLRSTTIQSEQRGKTLANFTTSHRLRRRHHLKMAIISRRTACRTLTATIVVQPSTTVIATVVMRCTRRARVRF